MRRLSAGVHGPKRAGWSALDMAYTLLGSSGVVN